MMTDPAQDAQEPVEPEPARDVDFAPGFRWSRADAAIVTVGAIAAASLWSRWPMASAAIAFVLGHFFLFCNVFRIRRTPELVWAVTVVALGAGSELWGWPTVPWAAATAMALTVILIGSELRHPLYHGVGWPRLNPDLRATWESSRHAHARTNGP